MKKIYKNKNKINIKFTYSFLDHMNKSKANIEHNYINIIFLSDNEVTHYLFILYMHTALDKNLL